MPGRGDGGNRGARRPPGRGQVRGPGPGASGRTPGGAQGSGSPARPPKRRTGGVQLRRLGGSDFELVHPRCVRELELDYVEGMEIRASGDPEGARDALRYALQGCGDNLWVHVALGHIALEDFRDPSLARGHFGYAFELAQKAIPPRFGGRLPRERDANRPFYEAIEGLTACYEELGKAQDAAALRSLRNRLLHGGFADPSDAAAPPPRPRQE